MTDVELKRGYEVLPDNNVRFGIRVINTSAAAILDVEVILDYNESLFELEDSKLQNLGTIPPAGQQTAKFILKPRGCIHKEGIAATVRYKDPQWKRHSVEMRPKEVHCVCPFLKEKAMREGEYTELADACEYIQEGLTFRGISVNKVAAFVKESCTHRLYIIGEHEIDNSKVVYLAGESIGEKAYYLLTAVIQPYKDLTEVALRAYSSKPYGLHGFMNEIGSSLRHLISSVQSAKEVGIIENKQVITIIDSVVQRTTFAATGGEGAPPVTIKDSVVQRTEFKGDEEAKRRRNEEEERAKRAREEAEKKKQEEQERLQREEAEKKAREEQERVRKEEEKKERERKAKEIKEREAVKTPEAEQGTSRTKIFAVIIVLSAVLLGYWGFAALSHDDTLTGPPAALPTPIPTPTATSSSTPVVTPTPTATPTPTSAVTFSVPPPEATPTPEPTLEPTPPPTLEPTLEPTPPPTLEPTPPPTLEPTPEPTPPPTPAVPLGNTFTNSIGMEFMLIPTGAFEMGTPLDEEGGWDDERPVHQVTIKKAFYMGRYEVTQEQWRAVMGDNPSKFKGDDLPVEQVSWDDAQEFIKKLNAKEGTSKYRLPSEAEWEYACRAGTTTRYSFGDSDSKLGEYAWYDVNSNKMTHPVGQKKPNPWGLYDMHGNVYEWVQDTWHDNYDGAPTDGRAWGGSSSLRVDRGGGWSGLARHCRSALRCSTDRGGRGYFLGFRLVRDV